jgi:hypothetical protein
MALRQGVEIEAFKDSANVIDEKDVPVVGQGWKTVADGGLCETLRNKDGGGQLYKRVHQFNDCICIPYASMQSARLQVDSDGVHATEMTPARVRFLERCIQLDGLQEPGDHVAVGATATLDTANRNYDNHVYAGGVSMPSVPNPQRRGLSTSHMEDNDVTEYFSGDEEEEEAPIEYELMPPDKDKVKFGAGTYLDVLKRHAKQMTGEELPAWYHPENTHFPAALILVETRSGDREVHVMRRVSIAWSVARFFETTEDHVEYAAEQELGGVAWYVLDPDETPSTFPPDARIRLASQG